jgi:hypothetical protein
MRKRRATGSAITEMGPALFVLIILIFFPMLNLVQIGVAYALANTYHQYISREIAFRRPDDFTQAVNRVNTETDASPLFQFVKLRRTALPTARYLNVGGATVAIAPTGNLAEAQRRAITQVRVTTTVECNPYFTIPFFNNLPGLGRPVPFTSTTDRPQDEKGLN